MPVKTPCPLLVAPSNIFQPPATLLSGAKINKLAADLAKLMKTTAASSVPWAGPGRVENLLSRGGGWVPGWLEPFCAGFSRMWRTNESKMNKGKEKKKEMKPADLSSGLFFDVSF